MSRQPRPVAQAPPAHAGVPRRDVTIIIGGVAAAKEPTLIRTLLGSCVSACLYDPVTRIGGMNHFMLPYAAEGTEAGDATRFGSHSMDCLIGMMMRLGADRRRIVAKVFGAGHVLPGITSADSVPYRNILFIRQYLADENIPVAGEDLGGRCARQVQFFTDTGRARVRQVDLAAARLALQQEQERGQEQPSCGSVELFD
ncbi:MAG: chemotaxis protein CheD [Planctomycetes bacterium]|nr:chemotaxis protein CheD [Planctomycetota bacterium]